MRGEGRLGSAGDRGRRGALRRRRSGHHPRQRPRAPRSTTASAGRSPRSTPSERSVVLDGIDQARRVEVGPDYLARTNPHGEAPALQHAYAVTTYSAQGATVDRAYVMADPSMDKQELYVAASRSREETYLYATPEIQAEREEIAPRLGRARSRALAHIAEAAERDRAQLPPTTRRCAPSCRSCRPPQIAAGATRSFEVPPRRGPPGRRLRPARPARPSAAASATSRPSPSAKQSNASAGASAARELS